MVQDGFEMLLITGGCFLIGAAQEWHEAMTDTSRSSLPWPGRPRQVPG